MDEKNPAPKISLDQALHQISLDGDLSCTDLKQYVKEDKIGGFYFDDCPQITPRWSTGSLWHVEGQVLYALVRALKPKNVMEIGSFKGCSTSHIAAALKANGHGLVWAIDPYLDFSGVKKEYLPYIKEIKGSIFDFATNTKFDMIYEDGLHGYDFTKLALSKAIGYGNTKLVALSHDYHHFLVGGDVSKAFNEVFKDKARSVLIEPSNCGLGYAFVNQI